jgi:hypothetical protein
MASIINVDNIRAVGSSTTGITVDSSGRVSLPQIPCAVVSLTTSNSQDTSNPFGTTGADILFDAVTINQGSVYNSSNGRFTAPIAGIYELNVTFLKDDDSGANTTRVDIYKNGSLYDGAGRYIFTENITDYLLTSGTTLLDLSANDYVTLRLGLGGIYIDTDPYWHSIVFKLVG